jgi:hypothetical protein
VHNITELLGREVEEPVQQGKEYPWSDKRRSRSV